MNKTIKIIFGIFTLLVLSLSLASAMTIKSVNAENFQPGEEQDISVKIKNTLDVLAEDVSVTLDMANLPFSVTDSDEKIDEIDEDDTENFDFKIKATTEGKAGDYLIPYTITYTPEDGTQTSKKGTFSLTIEANPEFSYSVNTDNGIIGMKGKIKFSIINKGLGDARFVSLKIIPTGYTLLSSNEEYIGTIGSDDFETVTLDVIFNEANPSLNAEIEYRDFENQKITKTVNLPVTIYSSEDALKLGIIQPNNTVPYVVGGIVIFAGWMVYRKIRKKRKQNKSQGR